MEKILKELLSHDKHFLQILHQGFNFDFMQEVNAAIIEGSFTHNSVKKAAGVDFSEHNACLIITGVKYQESRLFVVPIYASGFGLSIPGRVHWSFGGHYDYFNNKSRFEAIRKEKNITTFVIFQERRLEKIYSQFTPDFSERYKYISKIGLSDGRWRNGISRITLKDSASGATFDYKPEKGFSSTETTYFVDKSGYIAEPHKNDLIRRAAALKADRKKAAAAAVDFSGDIAKLDCIAAAKKAAIIKALSAATDYNSLSPAETALRRFSWVLMDIEHFKTAAAKKSFSSPAAAYNKIDYIMEKLQQIAI